MLSGRVEARHSFLGSHRSFLHPSRLVHSDILQNLHNGTTLL
jgi:hypothetical protein